MNIVIRIDQYDDKCIYFCEPIKNNIMNDGNFIRILYTNPQVTLNGVYLFIKLNDVVCEKYYNKYKCNFDIVNHNNIIDNLKVIEENILKKLDIKDKTPQFKIYEQIKNGNIKIFNDIGNKSSCSFILKISGIWETLSNFGLTYKFVKVD